MSLASTAPALAAAYSACGKVILLGEHSVVHGRPALAVPLGRRLRVTLGPRNGHEAGADDERAAEALAVAARGFGVDGAALRASIDSAIPPGAGLGSSAALSVALVGALAVLTGLRPAASELASRAAEVENVFHGRSSGLDVAVVAAGGPVWFLAGEGAHPLRAGGAAELVVGLSGERRATDGPVARLGARVAAEPRLWEPLLSLAGDLAMCGAEAFVRGDWKKLGELFDAAHGLLNAFGVSTPTLEHMVSRARAAGALGAKLTGGGGGGAMIALAPGRAAEVAKALAADGFETFVTTIGGGA